VQVNSKVLAAQLALLVFFGGAVFGLAVSFPYPSPLIKPLLAPKLRWPTEQVMGWVEAGQFDRDFAQYFARDPERQIPAGNNLVSAADGILQRVDYREGVTYVVVGLSFWDVHVVRTPLAGTVTSIEPVGTWYDRKMPHTPQEAEQMLYLKGKSAPVQVMVTIATKLGDIRVRLITSYWASRLRVWVHPGEKVSKGQRIGRILLGSTVVSEFPGRVAIAAKLFGHVEGGASVLGKVPS